MKFSIVICGYNEASRISNCIASCLRQNYSKKEFEVLYVDNNSKDNTLDIASGFPIKILQEKKQGLSESRNTGILNSVGEIICFLDADTELESDYLKNMEEFFLDPVVGAGGGKVIPLIQTWVSNYLGVSLLEGYPRDTKTKYVSTYPGCNLNIKRKVLQRVGVFKENSVSSKGITRYGEDKEICSRIRAAGYKIFYNPRSIVKHENTHTFIGLLKVWTKGSKSRALTIVNGGNDIVSIFFKYNIPILVLFFVICTLLINILVLVPVVIFLYIMSFTAYINTRLFISSFFIKPWMDCVSLVIINLSIIYYKKNEKNSSD